MSRATRPQGTCVFRCPTSWLWLDRSSARIPYFPFTLSTFSLSPAAPTPLPSPPRFPKSFAGSLPGMASLAWTSTPAACSAHAEAFCAQQVSHGELSFHVSTRLYVNTVQAAFSLRQRAPTLCFFSSQPSHPIPCVSTTSPSLAQHEVYPWHLVRS